MSKRMDCHLEHEDDGVFIWVNQAGMYLFGPFPDSETAEAFLLEFAKEMVAQNTTITLHGNNVLV